MTVAAVVLRTIFGLENRFNSHSKIFLSTYYHRFYTSSCDPPLLEMHLQFLCYLQETEREVRFFMMDLLITHRSTYFCPDPTTHQEKKPQIYIYTTYNLASSFVMGYDGQACSGEITDYLQSRLFHPESALDAHLD